MGVLIMPTYNERSWQIDVISEINDLVSSIDKPIKRAGGENTLPTDENNLFPDVLLYGDKRGETFLQGWELKMPDTPITDKDFIENAEKKARNLGLDSFLLWNVKKAVLYTSDDELNAYCPEKTWSDCSHIKSRQDVKKNENDWIDFLEKILREVNELFEKGELNKRNFIKTFSENQIIDIILQNSSSVAEELEQEARINGSFDADLNVWWKSVKMEYPDEDRQYRPLAKNILTNWVNKLIFAHVLKTYYSGASNIETIDENTSPREALKILEEISDKCDFWPAFEPSLGESLVSGRAWNQIKQLNGILSEIRFEEIDQKFLGDLLNDVTNISKQKSSGQFVTPPQLADLLARLTMRDKTLSLYDPFCGTGTILRSAQKIKEEHGINTKDAIKKVWGSDKFSFPLQIAIIAMSDPKIMGELIHIFRKDIADVEKGMDVEFVDPNNGNKVTKNLPEFDYIASNLPFVQQEDFEDINPDVVKINDWISSRLAQKKELDGRSDLLAYLPFYLWDFVSPTGRVGLIVSNSWLGTKWGKTFRNLLRYFYQIENVVTSGSGRWFKETDVVTNIIVLKKRETVNPTIDDEEETVFSTLNQSLHESKYDEIRDLSALILSRNDEETEVENQVYNQKEISFFEDLGLEWSSFFAELDWLLEIKDKLIAINEIFDIGRGKRRGWNDLFYPNENNEIEDQYLKPLIKSPTSIDDLITEPSRKAFCCSKSIDELKKLGHKGALNWIQKFKHATNNNGDPLPEVLEKSNRFWYEMKHSPIADFIVPINPDKRLFISKVEENPMVDQRLTYLKLNNSELVTDSNLDNDICHALLNSILGLFYIEALGFGRGLGALDLNATKIRKNFHMLNPHKLTDSQKDTILQKFNNVLDRSVKTLPNELDSEDRQEFDKEVLQAYGIDSYHENIENALKRIYEIRKAVDK